MPYWLVCTLSCMFGYGIWGFLAKVTTERGMNPLAVGAVSSLALFLTTCVAFYWFVGGNPWGKTEETALALLCGTVGGIAVVMFFIAVQNGPASLVVPLSALYPSVTIALSLIFLNERPSGSQTIGIGLTIVAAVLLGR